VCCSRWDDDGYVGSVDVGAAEEAIVGVGAHVGPVDVT
jgi:hypothetical protein